MIKSVARLAGSVVAPSVQTGGWLNQPFGPSVDGIAAPALAILSEQVFQTVAVVRLWQRLCDAPRAAWCRYDS